MGRHGQGSWDEIRRGARVYTRFRITIDGRTVERTGPSRRALEATAAELQKRARRHLVTDDEEITLTAWTERWIEAKELELGVAGAKTLRNYKSVLARNVVPILGRVKLRDLRADHRRRLMRELVARGRKASTINQVDGVLRACLLAAANEELPVVVSAIAAVRPVKGPPEQKRVLTTRAVKAIIKTAVGGEWWALWVAFVYTGARDAEVRALRWSDYDGATITIRRQLPQSPGDPPRWQHWLKGRKIERVVPVVPPLATALAAHRVRQDEARRAQGRLWSDYDLIFPDEVGRALKAQRVGRAFTAAVEAAEIETWKGLGVHRLRGATNEILREARVDAPTRSAILGHTVAVNEGYYTAENARLMAEAMATVVDALE